jgi:hypothetical protein
MKTANSTKMVRQPVGTNHFQLRDHHPRRTGGGVTGGIGGGWEDEMSTNRVVHHRLNLSRGKRLTDRAWRVFMQLTMAVREKVLRYNGATSTNRPPTMRWSPSWQCWTINANELS